MNYVQAVVEDVLQETVLQKLISTYRPDLNIVGVAGKKGNDYIRHNIKGFNQASAYLPHIVLTDLDTKPCTPALMAEWINFELHPNFLFRVAEKEIEAWILSDRDSFAGYLGVSVSRIPRNTQILVDPKLHIINLAKISRKSIMKDMVPKGTSTQGPGYNLLLHDFVLNHWNPQRACANNRSLSKAVERIKVFLK